MPNDRIAYILSRFPVLTETFIIVEIEELRRRGINVEVFSLKQARYDGAPHGNTEGLINATHYIPYLFSVIIWKSLVFYLSIKPRTGFNIMGEILRTHIRNPILLFKTLAVLPKTFAIAMTIRSLGITKIHAHWATIPATSAWVVAKLNDISFTFTAHAWDIFQTDTMLSKKILDARKVVTISEYNKKYLLEKYQNVTPEKITVIHCGVDLARFTPRTRTRDKKDPFTILSIGRMTEKKGFDVLLDACRILKDRGIPYLCRIVYVNGSSKDEVFRRYKRLELSENVEFIPRLPQEGVINEYSNADCFVLPCIVAGSSDRDGIPVVIMEALAMELPVVTTSISGIPEVIKDNETGLLVDPGKAEDLADGIERIYCDPELREKLGEAGRDFVQREFEISSSVDRLIKTILS